MKFVTAFNNAVPANQPITAPPTPMPALIAQYFMPFLYPKYLAT